MVNSEDSNLVFRSIVMQQTKKLVDPEGDNTMLRNVGSVPQDSKCSYTAVGA